MEDVWKLWLARQPLIAPDNATEIDALEADGGRTLGYVSLVGRRRPGMKRREYAWPDTLRAMLSE